MVPEIVHIEPHGLRSEAHGSSSFLNQVSLSIIQLQFNSCSFSSEIIYYRIIAPNQLYCEGRFSYFISLCLLETIGEKLHAERSECDRGGWLAVKKRDGGEDWFQVFVSLRAPPCLDPVRLPGLLLADKLVFTGVSTHNEFSSLAFLESAEEEAILHPEGDISNSGIFRCQWQVKKSFLAKRNLSNQILTCDLALAETMSRAGVFM